MSNDIKRKVYWSKRWKIAITLFLIIISPQIHTQSNNENKHLYNNAEVYESLSEYEKALPLYKTLVDQDPDNANYNFKYGYCLVESHAAESAIPYFEKAKKNIDKNYRSSYKQTFAPYITLYYLAKEYHRNYQFAEALQEYESYEQYLEYPEKSEVERLSMLKKYCQSGMELIKAPKHVKHLDFSEAESVLEFAHSPIFSPDGSIYIFTTDKSPDGKVVVEEGKAYNENIYYTYFSEGAWIKPQILSSNVTTSKNEASVSIHPNGKEMIIYIDDNNDGNLYYSTLIEDRIWSKPKKYPSPINSSYQESHATLSADGNTIYFTSDRPGGFGGLDIYMCHKDSTGKWGEAINMGDKINSIYHEESPHLQADGDYLYFSSDRPESMGGFDVFYCQLEDNKPISEVQNIGYPINTPYNDLFFKTTADGSTGYFSTSCRTSKGELDLNIVQFLDIPRKPNVKVRGLVLNGNMDTLYNLNVNLFDIALRDIIDSTKNTESNKHYEFNIFNQRKYFASFEYDGYVYFSAPFEVEKYFARMSFSNVIELEPIILDENSLRQTNSDFIFTSRLLKEQSDFSDSLSKYDIVNQIEKENLQNISNEQKQLLTITDKDAVRRADSLKRIAYINDSINKIRQIEDSILLAEKENAASLEIVEIQQFNPENYQINNIEKDVSLISSITQDLLIQEEIKADSIRSIGMKEYQQADYIDAITQFYEAIDIYSRIDKKHKQIDCYNRIAECYIAMGDTQNALKVYEQAIALIDKNNLHDKGKELYAIGELYDAMYLKMQALDYLEQSQEVREEAKDIEGELQSIEKIGDVYYKHAEYQNAINQYNEAISLAQDENFEHKTAQYYNKKGLAEQAIIKYDLAKDNFKKAIDIAQKYEDRKAESIYLNNLANVEYEQENYQDAINNYNSSIKIKREIGYEDGLALSLHNLANSHRKLKEHESAIRYYNESLDISEKFDNNNLQAYNHFGLSQSYAATEIYDQALFHYKEYINLRSPHLNSHIHLQASQEIAKYEIGSEELTMLESKIHAEELLAQWELRHHTMKMEEMAANEQRQKLWIIILIAFGIISLGILTILCLLFYGKRKNHKKLKELNEEIIQKNEEITTQCEKLELNKLELEKLSIVATETANAVAIIDNQKNFEWTNTAFTQLFNEKTYHPINNGDSIYTIATSKEIENNIAHCFEQKNSVTFTYPIELTSGDCLYLRATLTPIINPEGEITKIVLIESDITSMQEANNEINNQIQILEIQSENIQKERDHEEQLYNEDKELLDKLAKTYDEVQEKQAKLAASEKMASLGRLVAGVAHEINTPIGIGIAATTSLKTKTDNLSDMFKNRTMKQSDLQTYLNYTKESADLILKNLQRAGSLTKSFKRVSVDKTTEQRRKFNLGEYIKDEAIMSLTPTIRERNTNVVFDWEGQIEMDSYPGTFFEIISNMVVNSINHAYKDKFDGTITISLKEENDIIHFTYSDDGCGMTEEVREHVFDPFFTTNMQSGTGLGMNLVYNRVKKILDGNIKCISELGKGTTYIMEFPKVSPEKNVDKA